MIALRLTPACVPVRYSCDRLPLQRHHAQFGVLARPDVLHLLPYTADYRCCRLSREVQAVVLHYLRKRYLTVHTPKPLPNRQSVQRDRPLQTECWSGGTAGIFARTILSRRSTEPCRNGGVLCRSVRIKHPTSPTERDVYVHAKLATLRDQCVVTEQEFQEQKAKLLGTKTANQSQKKDLTADRSSFVTAPARHI